MRRVKLFVFLLLAFSASILGASQDCLSLFGSQLDSITDNSLRQTLHNSIVAGIIENQHDFDLAVSQAEAAANRNNPGVFSAYGSRDSSAIRNEIYNLTAPIAKLDRDAIKVSKTAKFKADESYLFVDLNGALPNSYKKTIELCSLFNPKSGTNDAPKLDKEIDAFLDGLKNDPVIKHALDSTGTSISDLKKNWFGSGLGFEHVIAGELKGSKVSGYHFWYKFYHDEREGNTQIKKAIADIGNPKAFTGSFNWDPDGDGPLSTGYKPVGGFSIGNSVQAMLALGHIAMEVSRKNGGIPGAMRFEASINGVDSSWQLYTMNGNIRSLYPIKNNKTVNADEYYERESELVGSDYAEETLH